MSDTSEFIRKYANIIITSPKWYENVNSNKLLAEVINSKMLVLSNDGHGEVVGTGWIEEDGVMYSNSSFKSYAYNKYYTHTSSYYNDDYLYEGFEPTWCRFWSDGKPSKECYGCYTYDYCWKRRVI